MTNQETTIQETAVVETGADNQVESKVATVATDVNLPALAIQSTTTMKKLADTIEISPEHMQQAGDVADKFDFDNTNNVLTYGAGAQRKYLENLKELVRNRKVGELHGAADIILSIEKGIDMIGLDNMKKELEGDKSSFLVKVFKPVIRLVGGAKTAIQVFIAKRQDLFDLIQSIENDTDKTMQLIMQDNARLDVMYGDVETNFYELGICIVAGEMILGKGQVEYNELRQKAIESGDAIQISEVNHFREQIVAFDSRLLRMKSAYVKAPITLQKVLTTQQAGRIEIQNLMDSILFDLPALLETINMLLSLFDIKGAQEGRKKREDLSRRLQDLSGDLLDEVATTAKKDQARGAQEVAMIEQQANQLLGTLKKMKEIDTQNAQVRADAENLLVDVMGTFRKDMTEITAPETIANSANTASDSGRDAINIM